MKSRNKGSDLVLVAALLALAACAPAGEEPATNPATAEESRAAAAGCQHDYDCPVLAYCIPCSDGTCVGPTPFCDQGQCRSIPPMCPDVQCKSDAECPVPAYCRVCEDGTCVSPTAECLNGQCVGYAPVCPEDP